MEGGMGGRYLAWLASHYMGRGRPSYLISHKTGYSTRGGAFFFSTQDKSSELFDINNNADARVGVAVAKLNGLDWNI